MPEDWGWKLTVGKLLPVRTDLPPAHASLLEMVRCNRRKIAACRDACAGSMVWIVPQLVANARVTVVLIQPRLTWMQIRMLTDG